MLFYYFIYFIFFHLYEKLIREALPVEVIGHKCRNSILYK